MRVQAEVTAVCLAEHAADEGLARVDVGHSQRIDCFASSSCHVGVDVGRSSLVLRYRGDGSNIAMAVLYVEYGTQESADLEAGVGAYRASWAVRLRRP